jgi:hypothetical protein
MPRSRPSKHRTTRSRSAIRATSDARTTLPAILGAAKRLAHVKFAFTGGGAQLDAVKSAAPANAEFRPYVPRDQLSESLSSVDAHLVSLKPSLEGLIVPSKFYGILAVARPVLFIGARDGELARLIEEYRCGIVVEPGDVEGLVRAIESLARDRDAAMQMGLRGRAVSAAFRRICIRCTGRVLGDIVEPRDPRFCPRSASLCAVCLAIVVLNRNLLRDAETPRRRNARRRGSPNIGGFRRGERVADGARHDPPRRVELWRAAYACEAPRAASRQRGRRLRPRGLFTGTSSWPRTARCSRQRSRCCAIRVLSPHARPALAAHAQLRVAARERRRRSTRAPHCATSHRARAVWQIPRIARDVPRAAHAMFTALRADGDRGAVAIVPDRLTAADGRSCAASRRARPQGLRSEQVGTARRSSSTTPCATISSR